MKYQIYNALFLALPFTKAQEIGLELPAFADYCSSHLLNGKSPEEIINGYFNDVLHTSDFKFIIEYLFLVLQFIERQIVLFDALEDASFARTHDLKSTGTLNHYLKNITNTNKLKDALQTLKNYRLRLVLTAHPTQFYPFQVLEIIEDLASALKKNDIHTIANLMLQLGKTAFRNPSNPTPLDEAEVLIYFLERIFYPVIINLQMKINTAFSSASKQPIASIFEVGFWPGGDRDGNPNVTPEVTLKVARNLKNRITKIYLRELTHLKRRLTFPGMWKSLDLIRSRLKNSTTAAYKNATEFLNDLYEIKNILITQHNGLFIRKLDRLIIGVQAFGFHFAKMDLRQDSHAHSQVIHTLITNLAIKYNFDEVLKIKCQQYLQLSDEDKMTLLLTLTSRSDIHINDAWLANDPLCYDVINSLRAVKTIQTENGEEGLNRYVISNTKSAFNVIEIILLAQFAQLDLTAYPLDIIPLFESVNDLNHSETVMKSLYELPIYINHLTKRKNQQVVMLGFSDGTKDGGYITANWAIYQCKRKLFELSKIKNINIQFFDGRGGPPARGGGNTHKFYRAMEETIEQQQIQLTIQGQTISSTYGTKLSASYNLEQLFTSCLLRRLYNSNLERAPFSYEEETLLNKLSSISYDSYQALKQHPLFVTYLENVTPLQFYGELNITSRPPSRKNKGTLQFKDLRAISFVSAWSQIKQNVPGFYGLGTALKKLMDEGQELPLKQLYHNSLYFRTLLENAMQSLLKTNFAITQYLKDDANFGAFWQMLCNEAELSKNMLLCISEEKHLLSNDKVTQHSINIREDIVLPLLIIQQYAMMQLRKGADEDRKNLYKKLILKSLAANINASRNSA